MSLESIFKAESSESGGKNIEVNITVVRHAQKESGHNAAEDGSIAKSLISEGGKDRAEFFGQMLKHEERDPKVIGTTYVERTKQTAESILSGADATDRNIRESIDLGFSHTGFINSSPEFREKYNSQVNENRDIILAERYGGKDLEELTQDQQEAVMYEAEDPVVSWWLSTKDRPLIEGDQTITPRDAAALSAYQYAKVYNVLDKMKDDSKEDYLVVSHQCIPEPFLAYTLLEEGEEGIEEDELEPGEKLKRLGGSLAILDNFDIQMKTDEEKKKSMRVQFRGQEYKLDMEKFAELAERGEQIS